MKRQFEDYTKEEQEHQKRCEQIKELVIERVKQMNNNWRLCVG